MTFIGNVGIANLPNQLHKIVYRKGATFNLMVVGESGLGKTTYINTLFTTSILPSASLEDRNSKPIERTVKIHICKAVAPEKGFVVNLNVIDTPGFGDYVNNSGSWDPIMRFIDDQHESYFRQESQPNRQNLTDMRVHAVLYFINPTGHSLRPLDVEVMKQLGRRCNLIPVIAKADTISPRDRAAFKERIHEAISRHQINVYTCPLESEDEETTNRNIDIMSSMPFAVIGSTQQVTGADGKLKIGRQYPWGVAEVENDDHCDFKKLRSLLIRTHMHDLISTTEEVHYENYRMNRLENRGSFVDGDSLARYHSVLFIGAA
eukprot:Partr_v1_DN25411_c0_g1_i4_m53618 putative Cell division control protein